MTPSAGKHNGCGPANRDGLLDPASRSISESIPETILITEQQPHYLTRGNRLMRIVRFTVQNDLETQAYALASEADLIECGALAPEPSAMTEEELGAELDKMRHICETQRVTITDLRRRFGVERARIRRIRLDWYSRTPKQSLRRLRFRSRITLRQQPRERKVTTPLPRLPSQRSRSLAMMELGIGVILAAAILAAPEWLNAIWTRERRPAK